MTLPIPDAALDDRLGFVGTAGSGKTYNAGGRVERLLEQRARVVIADPLGVWWGLRLAADGKTPSPYDVVIFGGPHGDLPLTEHAGALIGETVAGMAESCIVDLSGLGTKAAERRFMLHFLSALYTRTAGEPMHLILDESDMWAPQRLLDKEGEAAKLLGMVETIVRRGRVKGFIPWLISQRPAVVSKDVLSQVDGLVAFKLTSSQDRDALEGWIEGQADRDEWKRIRAALPTLPRGTGVVWVPGRDILATAAFPQKRTFDSSRTPKRGERQRHATLRPIDLGKLKERLATVEAETKANDPKTLKAEITRLRAELANGGRVDPAAVREAEARAQVAGKIEGYREAMNDIGSAHRVVVAALLKVKAAISDAEANAAAIDSWLNKERDSPTLETQKPPRSTNPARDATPPAPVTPHRKPSPVASGDGSTLPRPQRRILAALSFWQSIGDKSPTREQVAAVAGYSPGSSHYSNMLGAMHTADLIGYPHPGRVAVTPAGARHVNGAMTPSAARSALFKILTGPQRALVTAAQDHAMLTREELATRAGYSPASSHYSNTVGQLCTLTVFDKPQAGHVGLTDWARKLVESAA